MVKLILFAAGFCIVLNANAQSYNTAFGIRFGEDPAFSVTQRIANHTTADIIASDGLFSSHKFVSLQIRNHYPVITRRLNCFLGAGGFVKNKIQQSDEGAGKNLLYGISGVIGAEFTIGRLNISLDYAPQYIIDKDFKGQKLMADSALSVKYVLWKRKSGFKKFFEKIF